MVAYSSEILLSKSRRGSISFASKRDESTQQALVKNCLVDRLESITA